MADLHKIVVVTPAGRKKYLNLLKAYILDDPVVSEWHLWDNCRSESDRVYIEDLAKAHDKIKIIKTDYADGTNSSVNRFYKFASDPNTFYFKVDDDIIYIKPGTFDRVYKTALTTKDDHIWWSPLVINNAVCSWILKYKSKLNIAANLSAQAADSIGWRSPYFAKSLHALFLHQLERRNLEVFEVSNTEISGGRFSINFIGFFGSEVKKDIIQFCPPAVDDEEWISAVLPALRDKRGLVVGDCLVSHFSYYTQERYLLKSGTLRDYYDQIGPLPYEDEFSTNGKNRGLKQIVYDALIQRLMIGPISQKNTAVTLNTGVS